MFDIAVNLADAQIRNRSHSILENAWNQGLTGVLALGTDWEESTYLFQKRWDERVHLTAGTHPHYASTFKGRAAFMPLWQDPRCVAVGECGLDFYRMLSSESIQIKVCAEQMDAAVELNKPIYLHDRDAGRSMLALMEARPELQGVVHCFTGDKTTLFSYLDRGFYIGLTAWCLDERRGQALAELVAHIPDDRLLVETDSPYLVPRTLRPRPKRNEPAFLGHIIEGIAGLRGQDPDHLARLTTTNARRMLRLD